MTQASQSHNPVLFLDFDGVLHPVHAQADQLFTAIPLLELVLREFPNLDVVVSSSWREVHPLDELLEYFSADIRSRFIGITPARPELAEVPDDLWSYVREGECAVWIARHRPWVPWIAVDDDAWRFKPHSKRLFLVEGKIGLTAASLEALRLRLEALAPVGRKRNPLG